VAIVVYTDVVVVVLGHVIQFVIELVIVPVIEVDQEVVVVVLDCELV
jgi:hypothetical protein